jgi:hypothetical protein
MRKRLAALAVLFLAAHLPFLPPTLEDIDSINFALGVRDFDVARHQPHPPGYPVFIALGKLSTPALRAAGVASPEPRGLAVWSAVCGAALVAWLFAFFRGLHDSERLAWWATVVVVTSPVFWFTALRPLSDMTGLCAAVASQALITRVIAGRGAPWSLMGGACLAGLAIGVRAQTFLLTLPLLGLALMLPGPKLRARDRVAALAAAGFGVIAWGIPLLVASGGLAAYTTALGAQAGEDFSGVVMLWTTWTRRVALDSVMYSLFWPWGRIGVGTAVLAVALVGAVRVAWRIPKALVVLTVAFLPYAVFHLLFHEVVTVRYALPLVVPIAYFGVYALDGLGRVALTAGAVALAAVSMGLTLPAAAAYGRVGSPTFRALHEAADGRVRESAAASRVVAVHAVARRAAEWVGSDLARRVLTGRHGREWLALVEQWRTDPQSTVSFVADPRRTDLALFDPMTRRRPLPYRWGFVEPPFVGGARPGDADIVAMRPPGWMLDRGWSLTAEVAGITGIDGWGPHKRPSIAWIRRRGEEALLMIGGRHLSSADPAVRISLTLSGRPLTGIEVKPGFFFTLVPVPPGALEGEPYRPLEVNSRATDGSLREIPVALEQFDLQSAGVVMVGAEAGWHEPEYDPRLARSWRWTSERATLWVRPVGRDVTLTLAGESPLWYYDTAPTVTVSVAGRQVSRFTPSSDFTQEIQLPADALASAAGRVVIESDKWFVPAERSRAPDRRHLALRIYSFGVR